MVTEREVYFNESRKEFDTLQKRHHFAVLIASSSYLIDVIIKENASV
jgi:hypothetical protein